jgi:hypothetical protein
MAVFTPQRYKQLRIKNRFLIDAPLIDHFGVKSPEILNYLTKMPTLVLITTNHFYNEYINISSMEEITLGLNANLVSEFHDSGTKRGLFRRSGKYYILLRQQ